MHGKALIALAAAPLMFATSAQASTDEPDRFTLEMTISDNGEVVAQRSMVATEGEPTFVDVKSRDGSSYRAQFFISDADKGLIKTRSHWKASSPTLGTISFSPILKIKPGESARIIRGDEGEDVQPLHVTYTVVPLAG